MCNVERAVRTMLNVIENLNLVTLVRWMFPCVQKSIFQ